MITKTHVTGMGGEGVTVWLICSAEGPMPEGALTGEEYRAARREAMKTAAVPEGEKPLHGEGRRICISGAPCARISAEALCPGAEYAVRAELDEAEPHPGFLSDTALPPALRAFLDAPRGEAKRAARKRAEALIAELEKDGRDCVLFSHPGQIPLLMDALRRRGCCFNRFYTGAVRPLERILATSRTAHCGGCGHNCMLSNPGCGVGRDKARRAGIPFKT